MHTPLPIPDVHVFPLLRSAAELVLLGETDYVLRRFGQLTLRQLAAGETTPFELRAGADRIFFPLDGPCEVRLLDLRPHSPSLGASAAVALDAAQPQGVLVPFGVALSLHAGAGCRLLLLSTHAAVHPGDRAASADELAQYGAA